MLLKIINLVNKENQKIEQSIKI